LLPRGPCAPSVSPPTVKPLVCPLSRSHWYSLLPLEIVLGSYVIKLGIVLGSYVKSLKSFNIIGMYYSNINEMSCFYLFISVLYVFFTFIYKSQSLKMKKFWKKATPDFKFRIHLVNYNNSIRKTKSEPGVILEEKK